MTVKRQISDYFGVFFITITCVRWMPLFQMTGYHIVYNWFDYLKWKGHFILSYVIMPNHLHVMVAFRNEDGKPVTSIIGNGKRFMAYDIVDELTRQGDQETLRILASLVSKEERRKKKQHEVFQPSFDCKACFTDAFVKQKLNYIHANPCRGKWRLAEQIEDYIHSSARYYLTGEHAAYIVTDVGEIKDIDLTK